MKEVGDFGKIGTSKSMQRWGRYLRGQRISKLASPESLTNCLKKITSQSSLILGMSHFLYSFFKDFIDSLLEKEREGEKEGEKHWYEKGVSIGCFSYTP